MFLNKKLIIYSITKLTHFQGVSNTDQAASIAGSIAAAHYIRSIAPTYGIPVVLHTDHCAKKLLPWLDGMMDADEAYFKVHGEPLFSSHMIDLSEEPVEWNIETTAKYLKRAAPMKQWLEMEIGITGGEEDGVNNEDVDNNSLYTQPEDILNIYNTLSPISPYFSIAAGFGNVHGVYKPGNVKLHPELLGKHQAHVKEAIKSDNEKPVFFVFHGGSGSSKKEYLDAIGFGVVKVNVDTDMQFAYCSGIRDYMVNKREYVNTTVGNPDGEDKPNKKYFDVSLHHILRRVRLYTNVLFSPVFGFARVRRPCPSVSPRPSRTSTLPTSYRCL
jgi:fructose-bisphosphate aldolase class II